VTPDEREAAVEELGDSDKRILVATDCLSEGVNLQSLFTAVVHYD
jgi:superfamily II DNA/RNA helicase